MNETVSAKVQALVGQPTGGTGKPSVAPDPVNQPMIRHWAYAMDDMNPVYLDPEFADVVPVRRHRVAAGDAADLDDAVAEARGNRRARRRAHRDHTATQRHSSTKPATPASWRRTRSSRSSATRRLGDVISATSVYESVSDEKKTALGTGFFLTWLTTYTDQNGEVLGRQRFRVLRFKPAG